MSIIAQGGKSCLRVHLFFIMKEANFASYAHDNTPYITVENLAILLSYWKKTQLSCFCVFHIIK